MDILINFLNLIIEFFESHTIKKLSAILVSISSVLAFISFVIKKFKKPVKQIPKIELKHYKKSEININEPTSILSPSSRSVPLKGRDDEIEILNEFIENKKAVSIMVISGDGGSGKTRLALEICDQMIEKKWETGFVERDKFAIFLEQLDDLEKYKSYRPKKNTLLIFDYAAILSSDLAVWFSKLGNVNKFKNNHKLRIILLERTAKFDEGWLQTALGSYLNSGMDKLEIKELFDPKIIKLNEAWLNESDKYEIFNTALSVLEKNSSNSIPKNEIKNILNKHSWSAQPLYLIVAAICYQKDDLEIIDSKRLELAKYVADLEGNKIAIRATKILTEDKKTAESGKANLNKKDIETINFLKYLAACLTLMQGLNQTDFNTLFKSESNLLGVDESSSAAYFTLFKEALANPAQDDNKSGFISPDVIGGAYILKYLKSFNSENILTYNKLVKNTKVIETLVRIAQDFWDSKEIVSKIDDCLKDVLRKIEINSENIDSFNNILPLAPESKALAESKEFILRKGIELYKDNDFKKADYLNNLGVHLRALGRLDEALKETQKALEIREKLAADNPAAYLPFLAGSLNNLGINLSKLGRLDEALKVFEKALKHYEQLAAGNPEAYSAKLAMSLYNLGINLSELGRFAEAFKMTEKALKHYEQLAAGNPAAYLPFLANSLYNLGNCYSALGCFAEALKETQKALGIREKLAADNPEAYLPDLALSLNSLGIILGNLGRFDEALKETQKALGIREKLAADNPEVYSAKLAFSLNSLGITLSNLGRFAEALKETQKALGIREKLAVSQPAAYLPDLANSLNNCGIILGKLGRFAEALKETQKALGIREKLAVSQPAAYLPDLANSLNNCGIILGKLGRFAEALKMTEKALKIYEKLAADNPEVYSAKLALSLNNCGIILGKLGRFKEAVEVIQKALEIREKLAADNPAAYLPDLVGSLNNLENNLSN